ncbi:MAG: type II toxin-antitoxin system VapC family toxin [Nocardioides sp.]
MIVIDASAMVEALVGRDVEASLLDALAGDVAAPHLLDIEVVSVLRGLVLGHKLPQPSAEAALSHYFDLSIDRREMAPLVGRVWDLRHQFTSYDASYLALAEALGAPLHTCDVKLDGGGHKAAVRVHGRSR